MKKYTILLVYLFILCGILPVYGMEKQGVFQQILQDFFTNPPDLINLELSF